MSYIRIRVRHRDGAICSNGTWWACSMGLHLLQQCSRPAPLRYAASYYLRCISVGTFESFYKRFLMWSPVTLVFYSILTLTSFVIVDKLLNPPGGNTISCRMEIIASLLSGIRRLGEIIHEKAFAHSSYPATLFPSPFAFPNRIYWVLIWMVGRVLGVFQWLLQTHSPAFLTSSWHGRAHFTDCLSYLAYFLALC